MLKHKDKTSPLHEYPLRYPGQSINDQIDEIRGVDIGATFATGVFMLGLVGFEWVEWYLKLPPRPLLVTILATGYFAFAFYNIRKHLNKIKLLKLGRDGEMIVGQFLEDLRASGCKVFHDIVGERFNLDHVVISPQGIYSIETKTWSKSSEGGTIKFHGGKILINGHQTDRDLIQQAQAEASWLGELLRKSTGKVFSVKPVIVFPGWFIDQETTKQVGGLGVWLLNHKALPTFIANSGIILNPEDLSLVAFHLERYIQSQQAEK